MATVTKRRRNPRGVYTITQKKVGGAFPYTTYTLRGVTIRGVRIREQSSNREALLGRKQELEVADANAPDERQVTTHLTPDQLRQAEAAFLRLAEFATKLKRPRPYSLERAIAHFESTHYEPVTDLTIWDLIPGFMQELRVTRQCSKPYLKSSENDLRTFAFYPFEPLKRWRGPKQQVSTAAEVVPENAFGRLLPHDVTTQQHCYPFMLAQKFRKRGAPADSPLEPIGNKRWLNLRSVLKEFFDWMKSPPRGYIEKNPWDGVETKKWQPKPPERMSVRAVLNMMTDVVHEFGGAMVPYFALATFGGIRPAEDGGELDKLSVHPKLLQLVNFGTDTITIDETVGKGRRGRKVDIEPTLRAWLRAYPLRDFPIMPTNSRSMIDRIRSKHKLGHDVLRHSYISYHAGLKRSAGDAALNAGNSEAVTRKRYLNLPTKLEAQLFWRITPELIKDAEALSEFMFDLEDCEELIAHGEDALPARQSDAMAKQELQEQFARDNQWAD